MPARILIIEDDPASLELASYILGRGGHALLTAVDGVEGLRMAMVGKLDLILCDLQLPEMDGFGVIRHLSENRVAQSVPVVALSALSMPGDRETAIAAGFNGYLTKPITPETFLQEVDGFLPAALRSDSV